MRRHVLTLSRFFAYFGVLTAAAGTLPAQSTTVVNLGTVPATQLADGLGFNIKPGLDYQWAAIAAAGGKHARIQCSWQYVEQQTAPPNNKPASTKYIQDSNCVAGLAAAAKYGIHPTIVAGYSAPFHQILTLTLPHGATAGSTSMDVEFSSGVGGDTLENIKFPYDYICPFLVGGARPQCKNQISNHYSNPGSLITGVKITDPTHATLTLASALAVSLPADDTKYLVNEILYPSAPTNDATDPSVIAYANYVQFLAQDMAARGVSGDIEIWNEPPWKNDPWDYRPAMYDSGTYPGPTSSGANFGFAAVIQHMKFPAGVTATWNGTSGNGMASLLGPAMLQNSGEKFVQPSTTITKESFHPYAGGYSNPETALMNPECIEAAAQANKSIYGNGMNCYLPGEQTNSNLFQALQWDDMAKAVNPSYGIGHSITETGNLPPITGLMQRQAQSNLRQYLGYEAAGVTPIEFYQMDDGNYGRSFSFIQYDGSSYTPLPSYTAMAGLMSDIDGFANQPAAPYTSANLPSVVSYNGKFPLVATSAIGARDNGTANSAALFVWQLSACQTVQYCWWTMDTGSGGPVTVNIPSGMKVTAVRNLTTREDVNYTTNGQHISFTVTDDPVEIMTDPSSAVVDPTDSGPFLQQTSLALSTNPSSATYGSQVIVSAAVSPFSSKSNTTNGEVVNFYDGSTFLGTAKLASGLASIDVTSFTVGTHTLSAVYGGDKNFGASSRKATFTVSPAASTITISPLPDVTFGAAPATVSVSSVSSGIMHFYVSGPARINTYTSKTAQILILGSGTVTFTVKQESTSSYAASTASTNFNVAAAKPNLTLNSVLNRTYGAGPFAITSTSNSKGAITYSVVSGPASVSGNTVTIKGAGSIVLEASQAASGSFTSAQSTTSFTVAQATPQVNMPFVQPHTYGGSPFQVGMTSTSPGAITYSIAAGPASVSGNIVTMLGGGVITVKATQAATTNYKGATAQINVSILQAVPGLSLASIPTMSFSSTPVPLSAKSLSNGQITYTVVSGPGRISGNNVIALAPGYITVQATQAATSSFIGATTRTGFRVNEAAAKLTIAPVTDKMTTSAPFAVAAVSSSPAPISYQVVSGPATINSNVVTVNGIGTVRLQAVQAAQGNYPAMMAKAAFLVIPTSADVQ